MIKMMKRTRMTMRMVNVNITMKLLEIKNVFLHRTPLKYFLTDFLYYPVNEKNEKSFFRKSRIKVLKFIFNNHAALPNIEKISDEESKIEKDKIIYDLFFSAIFLKKVADDGGATHWAKFSDPRQKDRICGMRFFSNFDTDKKMFAWRVQQSPMLTKEEFGKVFK